MNRKIKFRAWDTTNEKMYHDELESIAFAKSGAPANASIAGFSTPLSAIGAEPQLIFQQFTGLKDKNGKEIYEGDIGRWVNENGYVMYEFGVATWHRAGVWFCKDIDGRDIIGVVHDEWEIIGNVYETPELIAKQKTDGH